MSVEFDREQLAVAYGVNRKPYTRPVLEKLEPGSSRYEAAKAAFAMAAKRKH